MSCALEKRPFEPAFWIGVLDETPTLESGLKPGSPKFFQTRNQQFVQSAANVGFPPFKSIRTHRCDAALDFTAPTALLSQPS